MIKQQISILALASGTFFLLGNPAYAYIDAGTGSMILQAIVGGIAAGLVVIKVYWHKITEFIIRSKKTKS